MPAILAPFIASTFTATAATIGATSVTYAAVIAEVVWAAALTGAAYLLQTGSKSQPLKRTLRAPAPPRWGFYGRTKSAGWAFLYEAKGSSLYIGLAFATQEIASFSLVTCDDREVTLGTSGGGWQAADHPSAGYMRLEPALGAADQAASELFLARIPTLWTEAHRNRGVACLYGVFGQVKAEKRQATWPNGFPEIAAVLQARPLRDPRDSSQLPDDPATWAHDGDNAAIGLLDFLTKADGARKPLAWINEESFRTAADACDRLVPRFGGTLEPFARAAGRHSFEEETRATIARFLAAMDGEIGEDSEGRLTLTLAGWEEPSVVLTDDHIASLEETRGLSVLGTVNDLQHSWTDPARDYEPVEGAPITDAASIALNGRLRQSLDFDLIQWGSQAYRMAMRHFRRENPPSRLALTVNRQGLACLGERVVRVTSESAGIDGVFRVLRLQPDGSLARWRIDLAEVTEAMFADVVPPADPSRDLPTLTPATIPVPDLAVMDVDRAGSIWLRASAAAEPDGESLTLECQWRRQGDPDWQAFGVVLSDLVQEAGPVTTGSAGDIYDIRARYLAATGAEGGWSPTETLDLS